MCSISYRVGAWVAAGALAFAWYSYDKNKQSAVKVSPGKAPSSFSQAELDQWNKKVLKQEAADVAAGVRKPDS